MRDDLLFSCNSEEEEEGAEEGEGEGVGGKKGRWGALEGGSGHVTGSDVTFTCSSFALKHTKNHMLSFVQN